MLSCNFCKKEVSKQEADESRFLVTLLLSEVLCLECAKAVVDEVDAELDGDWAEMENEHD